MAELGVDIVAVSDMTEADWGGWREAVAADPALASPYFRPEFTRIVGETSPRAAVARITRGGKAVGWFPHQRRGGAVQPLGAPMNDYHGVIAAAGEVPDLETLARLMKASRLNVTAWVGDTGLGEARRTVQVVLPEGGYDGWYAERRAAFGKFFKDKERAGRSLEAELGPMRVERRLRDPALLDWLIAVKREQYRRSARHDIFACGWTERTLKALMEQRHEGFGASMAALWAGDKIVAVEYSLHAGDQCHFWFPGYDPARSRCSPGILLTMKTMQLADPQGYRTFDFGFEGEHYKKYFCNSERWVREATVTRPGLATALSGAAAGLLNERVRASVRHRWAAIEACETSSADRLRGVAQAAGAALAKMTAGKAGAVPA